MNKGIRIETVMTPEVTTIGIHDTLAHMGQLLHKKGIRHLPVKGLEGDMCGIVSSTDFDRVKHGMTLFKNEKIEEYSQALLETILVESIMSADVVTVAPDADIMEACQLFTQNEFRALPVVSKGHLVGIVTPVDIIKHYMTS